MQSAFYPHSALLFPTGLLSVVYSPQSSFSMQFSVFVRSIKDLNLNLIKIRACVVGSRTQLTFLLLAASWSQLTSDHSDKTSWLIANLKVATPKTTAIWLYWPQTRIKRNLTFLTKMILYLVYLTLIYATFHEIACLSNLDYFFGCSYLYNSSTPFRR